MIKMYKNLIAIFMVVFLCVSCDDNNITDTKAYVMSQDFVEQQFKYPKEVDFNSEFVFEIDIDGTYIVLGKVIAKNALGVKSEYTYKVWLKFNSGDWADKNNWECKKIIIEDNATGEQHISENGDKYSPVENKTEVQTEQVDRIDISMKLYDELFRVIGLNDAGKMPDSEFKPQAEKLKQQIDANDILLTDNEKEQVKAHGKKLLDNLVTLRMERNN